jgi:hypothetical protein
MKTTLSTSPINVVQGLGGGEVGTSATMRSLSSPLSSPVGAEGLTLCIISIKVSFRLSALPFFVAVHKTTNIKRLCHSLLKFLQMDQEFVHKE